MGRGVSLTERGVILSRGAKNLGSRERVRRRAEMLHFVQQDTKLRYGQRRLSTS